MIELEGRQRWHLSLSLSLSGGGRGGGAVVVVVVVHGFDLYKQRCHIKEKKKNPLRYSHFITWSGTLDRDCVLVVQVHL